MQENSQEVKIAFDASASVDISPNKQYAYVTLTPPENGGNGVTREMIMQAINDAKVTFGIIQDEVDRLVKQPEYKERIEIARGVEPINGEDGYITYSFNTTKDIKPKERPDGTVDYFDLDILTNVKKGDLLATITPETEGVEGKNVLGEAISGKKGKHVNAPFGKNVIFSEDKLQIFAGIDGNVELFNNQLSVNPNFTVQADVDASTGNVDFIGNVIVYGSVRSGFKVKSGQDVVIKGMVESATVIAGRNLNVTGGILGTNKDEIIVNGDLNCKFIENCTVKVKGNITAEYITNANVICEGTLELIGQKACIIGGTTVVLKKIIAKNIGTQYNAITNIQLGSYGTIQEKKALLDKKLDDINANETKLIQIIDYLTAMKKQLGKLEDDKEEILHEAIRTKTKILLEKSTVNKELAKLSNDMEFLGKQNLECRGTLYRGTHITIKNSVFIADRDYVHTNFFFDETKQEIVAGTL